MSAFVCAHLNKTPVPVCLCGGIWQDFTQNENDTNTCFRAYQRYRECMCMRGLVHRLEQAKHVSCYKMKSLTGDFVYLIAIKPPPLPTWKSDHELKNENFPFSINSKQSSNDCCEEDEEEEKNWLVKTVPPPMDVTVCHFYPHLRIPSTHGLNYYPTEFRKR